MNTSEKLKLIRKILDLPQWKIAELCSVSQSYWSEIEMGEKQPNGAIILTLVSDFKVNPQWLRTGFGSVFSRGCRFEKDCPFQSYAASCENDPTASDSVNEKRISYKPGGGVREPLVFFLCPGKLSSGTEILDILLIDTRIREIDKKGTFLLENEERGLFVFCRSSDDKRLLTKETRCLGKVAFVIKRL